MTYQENLAESRDDDAEALIRKPIADDKTFEPPVDDSEPGPTRPEPVDGDNEAPGQDGNDLLIVNNGDGADFFEGETLDINILSGNDPDPSDNAGAVDEILTGGPGNDPLLGNHGNDIILGEEGTDLLIVNNGDGSDFSEGDAGKDTLLANRGNDAVLIQEGGPLDLGASADAAQYDPYKAFRFQVETDDAKETADQFVFDASAGDEASVSDAFFVKVDAETTTQSDAVMPGDFDGFDAASGFTPLIAFATEADAPLDLHGADPMMSFDDIM